MILTPHLNKSGGGGGLVGLQFGINHDVSDEFNILWLMC